MFSSSSSHRACAHLFQCQEGRYIYIDEASGATTCRPCQDAIASSTTLGDGATSVAACVCQSGFYEEVTNASTGARQCLKCDATVMDCSVPGVTIANMPIKIGGWRVSNTTATVYPCFLPSACVGADGPLGNGSAASSAGRRLAPSQELSTAGDALCAPGHTGFLVSAMACRTCSPFAVSSRALCFRSHSAARPPCGASSIRAQCGTCVEGFFGYKEPATLCTRCSGNMALAFVPGILLMLAATAALVVFLRGGSVTGGVDLQTAFDDGLQAAVQAKAQEKAMETIEEQASSQSGGIKAKAAAVIARVVGRVQKFSVKFKILLSLWQILQGLGAVFAIPFPPFYEQTVSTVGGLLQIELPTLMPLDCIVRSSHYSRLVFTCTWPLVAYALLFWLSKFLNKRGRKEQAASCINLASYV